MNVVGTRKWETLRKYDFQLTPEDLNAKIGDSYLRLHNSFNLLLIKTLSPVQIR